ncbi:hypothetical protein A3K86_13225 [Photobacterium jeanii]|uniref:Glycosyltransferase 2-like domain-containing protein n=1 Tax=Photobacterium jeanii TaxID=858640 RepID=A0A178KA09_9GAMM|nr:glycosyltransferase [Photobacterium jeanii]OAN13544.1 hypothetical protein A3K86_13225 [Photobacterium jeanii]
MISVCLATFNGEKYIFEQLNSILDQIGPYDEVIISDDNSTDRTIDIIHGFNDSRVKVYFNNNDKEKRALIYNNVYYVNRNFSNALEHASGDIIFLSDQDDIWLDGKVRANIEALKKADLVVSNCLIFDDLDKNPSESYFDIIRPSFNFYRTIYKSSFHGCCMAFRKEVLETALPLPNSFIGHDTWIGLVASKFYTVSFLFKPLVMYRRHELAVTTSSKRSTRPLWNKLLYRINLLYYFYVRFYRKVL